MRITFLLNQGLEDASSLGRHFPIAKELVKRGYEIKLLASHPAFDNLTSRHFWRDGVEVFYVGQMHVRKSANSKTYMSQTELLRTVALTTWQMARLAASLPTDAFQVCKAQPVNGLAALLARLVRHKPIYLDSDDYEEAFNRFSSGWQKTIVRGFERHLPRLAQGVTSHTRFNIERNVSYGIAPAKILYVPNGIDRQRFVGVSEGQACALRTSLGLDKQQIIVYVGNLSLANHPVDLLLDAFVAVRRQEAVRRREKSACLLLVGGGEDYQAVQARVAELGLADCVHLTGRVKPEQIPLYFKLADVSVEPVHDDLTARARSPLKVFESMAVGTPVIAGDVGDRREILGQAGLLVPPGSSDALAAGLITLLQDPGLRQQMSQVALARSEQYYWDVLIDEFEKVYRL